MKRKVKALLFVLVVFIVTGLIIISRIKDGNNMYSEEKLNAKSLIVKSEDITKISDLYETISEEEKLYLLKYDSFDSAKKAYSELKENNLVQKIITNTSLDVAEERENLENDEEIKIKNKIQNVDINEEDYVIALIDSGVNDTLPYVIGRVSVIEGEENDDLGHGTNMAQKIIEENENAKILSIKALDKNGHGTVASVYKAINYAIYSNVDIINLSLSGYSNFNNDLIKIAIKKAIDKGIIVVGSAGNKGQNVESFIPGNIDDVIVVGSANPDGTRKENSNYGKKVDYFIEANSSSIASAKMTGKLSKYYATYENVNGALADLEYKKEIFANEEKYKDSEKLEVSINGFNADATTVDLVMGTEKEVGRYEYNGWTYQKLILRMTAKLVGYTIDGNGNVNAKIEFRNYLSSVKKINGATVPIQWASDVKYLVDGVSKRVKTYPRPGKMVVGEYGEQVDYDGSSNNFKYSNPTSVWYTADKGELLQGPVTLSIPSGTHSITTQNVNMFNQDAVGSDLNMSIKVPYAVVLRINRNGGSLASQHGSNVGIDGDYVTVNNSKVIHAIVNGSALDSNGLANYNNSSALNLYRTGYRVADASKIYKATIGGTTKYFDQTTAYTSANFGGATNNNSIVDLLVNWTANTYNITYVLNGGTAGTNAPSSATYDSVVQISNPTRPGYTFTGWTLTDGSTSTAKYGTTNSNVTTSWSNGSTKVTSQFFKNLMTTHNGTAELTANWTPNTAIITIKKDGTDYTNSGINVALYQSGTAKYTYANATKSGATVTWTGVTAGTYDVYTAEKTTALTTLSDSGVDIVVSSSGSATINFFTLTLTKGTGINTVTGAGIYRKNYQSNIGATIKSGYSWENWSKTEGNTPTNSNLASTTVTLTQKTTLVANALATPVSITIKKDSGNWPDSGINVALYQSGTAKYSYANATKSGATVTWTGVTAGTYDIYAVAKEGDTVLIDTGEDVTVSSNGAKDLNYYTLTLNASAGIDSVTGAGIYLKNQSPQIVASVNPNYTWENWVKNEGNTPTNVNSSTTTVKLTSKTTLTANANPGKSNLVVNPNGGSVTISDALGDVLTGASETITTQKTYNADINYSLVLSKPIKDSLKSSVNYKVTYNYNGSGLNNTIQTYIETTYTDYKFSSWTKSSGFSGALDTYTSTSTYTYPSLANKTDTITAQYTTSNRVIGIPLRLPTPTWPGHNFAGWYDAQTGGTLIGYGGSLYTPTQNKTLYAHWVSGAVEITINKNDAEWSNSGINVALYNGTTPVAIYSNAIKNGSKVIWTGVPEGTYDVYASSREGNLTDLVDTGVDISVDSIGTGGATINYYGLKLTYTFLNISSVKIESENISTDNILKNRTVSIIAIPKSNYSFSEWTVTKGNTPRIPHMASSVITITKDTELQATATAGGSILDSYLVVDPGDGRTTVSYSTGGGVIAEGIFEKEKFASLTLSAAPIGGSGITIWAPTTFKKSTSNTYDFTTPTLLMNAFPTTLVHVTQYDGQGGEVAELVEDLNCRSSLSITEQKTFDRWELETGAYGTISNISGKIRYTFASSPTGYTDYLTAKYNTTTTISDQTPITLPEATRTGYTLAGWYTKPTGGTRVGGPGDTYTPDSSEYESLVGVVGEVHEMLYAQWIKNTSNVTFNPNGGSAKIHDQENTIISSGSETITTSKTYAGPYENILYATEVKKESTYVNTNYTITYNGNNGTVGTTNASNKTSTKKDTTTYIFSGWNSNLTNGSYGLVELNNGTTVEGYTYGPEENTTDILTANFSGTTTTTQTAVTLPTATRTGYTFNGWYTAANGGIRIGGAGDTYTPSSSGTLYAQWSANVATVNVRVDDTIYQTPKYNVALYSGTTLKYSYANATKQNEKVIWTGVTAGTYDVYASVSENSLTTLADTGVNIVVSATGEAYIDYYTLYLTKGTGINTANGAGIYLKTRSANISSSALSGYTWSRWETISGSSPANANNASTTVAVTETTTLMAVANINSSNLKINPNGGSAQVTSPTGGSMETITATTTYTQNYNTTLTLANPEKSPTTSEQTLTVTYNGNNGTVGAITAENTNSIRIGTTTYTGTWTKSSTFYGTWSGGIYTFPSNLGVTSTLTASYTSSVSYGTASAVVLPDATRSGYTFSGWYTAANGGTLVGGAGDFYTPTGNVTIYAHWTINKSTLTVNPNGGTVNVKSPSSTTGTNITTTKSYTQDFETTLTLGNPTKANSQYQLTIGVQYEPMGGTLPTLTSANSESIKTNTLSYTFSNWDYDSENFNGTLNGGTYTYGPEDGANDTVTAIYSSTITNTTQTAITLPNATKEGYTLEGWYTAESGGTKRGNVGETYTPTQEEILYAHWTATTVTITIKKDNSNWNANSGVKIELRQSGNTKYSATASSSSVSISPVVAGTYDIYASKDANNLTTLVDTGIDVTVTSTGTATIDYYTLTLNKGVGISAVSGAGTYLKNQSANIDATVSNGYTWQGWSVVSGDSPN